jgi:hypothetical protein
MEYHRKQAKALVRAFRAGEREAVSRAQTVLGDRAREHFALSDAQHVIAREQGFRTWRELKRAHESRPEWVDGDDVVFATDLRYGPDDPVEVVVRKRGERYDVSDRGRAVELAGRRVRWADVAERVVEDTYWLNVNRNGVVFVQSNGVRLDSLVRRVAECSAALYEELLDRELGSP